MVGPVRATAPLRHAEAVDSDWLEEREGGPAPHLCMRAAPRRQAFACGQDFATCIDRLAASHHRISLPALPILIVHSPFGSFILTPPPHTHTHTNTHTGLLLMKLLIKESKDLLRARRGTTKDSMPGSTPADLLDYTQISSADDFRYLPPGVSADAHEATIDNETGRVL